MQLTPGDHDYSTFAVRRFPFLNEVQSKASTILHCARLGNINESFTFTVNADDPKSFFCVKTRTNLVRI